MNATLTNSTVTASQPAAQYFTPYYPELAAFLENTDQALLIQQIHYWLQNEKVGYQLKDGRRWIYNGYKDWIEQLFPWKSVSAISRMVTDLEEKGWIVTKRFYQCKREIGFLNRPPAFHEDNQRKWYRLDYRQIYLDSGFDLLFKPSRGKEALKVSRRANLQKCKLQDADLQIAISNSANCINIDLQTSNQTLSNEQREKIVANVTKSEELTNEIPTADFCKDLSQTVNNLEEGDLGLAETLVKANVPPLPPRLKKATPAKREKFEWEVRVNKPYQDFVHWRANTHYVPQGERWAAGAESNAFSEIVNKSNDSPEKAQALWQQFLEYANRSAESARVRIENGMEASLPSCFEEKPQLDAVEVGKKLEGVKEAIKTEALPAVEEILVEAPGGSPTGEQNAADEQLTRLAEAVERQRVSWKNIKHPKIRECIQQWAEQTPGVVMTEEGPALSAEVMNVEDSNSSP